MTLSLLILLCLDLILINNVKRVKHPGLKKSFGRYEDIAKNPQKELKDIYDYFNLTLVEEAKTFVQEHASAKWHDKTGLVFLKIHCILLSVKIPERGHPNVKN